MDHSNGWSDSVLTNVALHGVCFHIIKFVQTNQKIKKVNGQVDSLPSRPKAILWTNGKGEDANNPENVTRLETGKGGDKYAELYAQLTLT